MSEDDDFFGDEDMDNDQDDMFGSSSDDEPMYDPPPPYTKTAEFDEFCASRSIICDEKLGFIQVSTFKEFYFPGQIVRGYAVLTAFNQIKDKEIHFRVSGVELPGAHADEVRSHLTSGQADGNKKKLARQTTTDHLKD
jgi:hypothetical protein